MEILGPLLLTVRGQSRVAENPNTLPLTFDLTLHVTLHVTDYPGYPDRKVGLEPVLQVLLHAGSVLVSDL